ncbi:MAG TPA: hypothetical protein VGR55_03070, partial [Candidatus Acidoferrum sp.]|nr:hypothetical protein [Candidatus Acidoferrum sp.]
SQSSPAVICQRVCGRRPPREGFDMSNPSQRHFHLKLSPLPRYKGTLLDAAATQRPLTTSHYLFFSTSYELPNLQLFYFYNVATVGVVG